MSMPTPPSVSRVAALALLATAGACGEREPYDWRNRELAWRYGPTTGTASRTHVLATGADGPGAIAEGWKCRLQDGATLTVTPYRLAASHALFGEATLAVGLFDRAGEQLDTFVSAPITAGDATFSFEVDENTARRTADLVLWFRDA